MITLVHGIAISVVAALNLVVITIICAGAVMTLLRVCIASVHSASSTVVLVGARQTLARWLSLALEFAVAADIVLMAVTPSWSELGMLAAVVALRMALNFSLERELAEMPPTAKPLS
jgi:uncharacterized membrane protein